MLRQRQMSALEGFGGGCEEAGVRQQRTRLAVAGPCAVRAERDRHDLRHGSEDVMSESALSSGRFTILHLSRLMGPHAGKMHCMG
jgi:hypothetical protein